MKMHTPPECQGQIVEVSYGWLDGTLFCRVYDRSDRTTSWLRCPEERANELIEEGWEPWNSDTSTDGWKPCDEPSEAA